MTARRRAGRRQSLRVRITLSFVVAAALLTTVLSAATYLSVGAFLREQRVHSTTRQMVFTLTFAREFLDANPGSTQRLVELLRSREGFDALVTDGTEWYSTALSLTPASIPATLTEEVGHEQLAYEYASSGDMPALVFGAPLPPPGANLYLLFSLADLQRTMSLLARVLAVTGLVVVTVAALLAQPVARRILRPLDEVSLAAQRVAGGQLDTQVVAGSSDELALLASSFNTMTEALRERIARERRFVAAVSHELRTPLAALHTAAETLVDRSDELPADAREAADLVAGDVHDLRRLVEELLEISELDSAHPTIRWERVDLRALAEAIAGRRRMDVAITGSETATWADKARVERILGNLLDNAAQHGGGATVEVLVGVTDGWCDVEVNDRGPGIAQEDLPHVFERFYKADASRTPGAGGIGLGLAIAAANAEALDGSIEAHDREGGGASFVLHLPRRDGPAGPARDPADADGDR